MIKVYQDKKDLLKIEVTEAWQKTIMINSGPLLPQLRKASSTSRIFLARQKLKISSLCSAYEKVSVTSEVS